MLKRRIFFCYCRVWQANFVQTDKDGICQESMHQAAAQTAKDGIYQESMHQAAAQTAKDGICQEFMHQVAAQTAKDGICQESMYQTVPNVDCIKNQLNNNLVQVVTIISVIHRDKCVMVFLGFFLFVFCRFFLGGWGGWGGGDVPGCIG